MIEPIATQSYLSVDVRYLEVALRAVAVVAVSTGVTLIMAGMYILFNLPQ